jgi:transcriptional regulator with XRE-family HTH domain
MDDCDESVAIDDILGLHKAIATYIVCNKSKLRSSDFRFLRKEMNLSQKRLAQLMGISESSIRDYEKDRRNKGIPGAEDRLIRSMYADDNVRDLIERISDIDCEEHLSDFILKETENGWQAAA